MIFDTCREKLRELLHLDESTTLHYQEFKEALKYTARALLRYPS